jgi:hypothetical protein
VNDMDKIHVAPYGMEKVISLHRTCLRLPFGNDC